MKAKNLTSTASNSHLATAAETVGTVAAADAPVEAEAVDAIAVVAAVMAADMVVTAGVGEGASVILSC